MSVSDPFHFSCVTCEMPISGMPVFHVGLPFCCAGCAADGPCGCSYDDVPAPELRGLGADVAATTPPEPRRHVLAIPATDADEEDPVLAEEEPALASVLG